MEFDIFIRDKHCESDELKKTPAILLYFSFFSIHLLFQNIYKTIFIQ